MKIGVIGLGSMGKALAIRLLKAGHDVTVYNRTVARAEALRSEGVKVARTPAEAAQGDAYITMLFDDAALEEVLYGQASKSHAKVERVERVEKIEKTESSKSGKDNESHVARTEPGGIIDHQNPNAIHISMSTISPALSARMSADHGAKKQRYIAAPVLGRPDVVERGELVIMTAGEKAVIEACQPIFGCISGKIYIVGSEPSQANTVKVTANFMISAMLQTFGESFALVNKAGVDPKLFYEMVSFDFFKSPIYQKYGKIIVEQNFDNGAAKLSMQAKDTRLAADCARELECPMPFLSVLQDTFLSAMARGKAEMDPCAITEIIAENAGIKPRR